MVGSKWLCFSSLQLFLLSLLPPRHQLWIVYMSHVNVAPNSPRFANFFYQDYEQSYTLHM
jgi:hypothetical protein